MDGGLGEFEMFLASLERDRQKEGERVKCHDNPRRVFIQLQKLKDTNGHAQQRQTNGGVIVLKNMGTNIKITQIK